LLFLVYINDLPTSCNQDSSIFLFADDAKLYKHITCENDCEVLQNSIQALQEWSDNWLLKLNVSKCKVLSVGRDVENSFIYSLNQSNPLLRVTQMSDLGVIIDDKLRFQEHIKEKINKAYSMVGLIKRNFNQVSLSGFIILYKSLVRSHLEYCNSVWTPYRKTDIEKLERVQKRATKIFPELRNMKYEDRLRACKLPTLKFRRLRGDMIESYKIITGKYDTINAPPFELNNNSMGTRGNDFKIIKSRSRYDLRKHFFTNRVADIWNSLPNHVVNARSTNTFKNRLDEFWMEQEIVFNFKAEISGTGSRSEGRVMNDENEYKK
jgi:hypothetical protein